MKHANVSTLKARLSHYLKLVQRGEEVVVFDRQTPIAKLVRISRAQANDPEVFRRLADKGLMRPPLKKLDTKRLFRDLPEVSASVVTALLEDRDEAR